MVRWIVLLMFTPIFTFADKGKEDLKNVARQIEKQYVKGIISDNEYVAKMDTTMNIFLIRKLVHMPTDTLLGILSKYRSIVFSSSKYKYNRSLYFSYLTINADHRRKSGEAFFYADKYIEEVGESNVRAVFAWLKKANHYRRIKNYEALIHLYENDWNYLKQFRRYPLEKDFVPNRYNNLVRLYIDVLNSYRETGQATKADLVEVEVRNLHDKLKNRKGIDSLVILRSELYLLRFELGSKLLEKKYTEFMEIYKEFNEKSSLLHSEKSFDSLPLLIDDHLIEYYIGIKDYIKAIEILENKTTKSSLTTKNQILNNIRMSEVMIATSNYKDAFELVKKNIPLFDEEYRNITTDMDELLYSHAEAEYNRLELQEAEKEKTYRLLWILGISLVSVVIILLLIILLSREKRLLKKINTIVEIQIEEVKQRTAKEEQRMLGQELHDGSTGKLAAILFTVEHIRLQSKESIISNDLTKVYDNLKEVYNTIRDKSHSSYNLMNDIEADGFDYSIQKIVETALPGSIRKEIDINKDASVLLNSNSRIELLRVLQESMVNIVKHARQVSEVLVFLYRDKDIIFFEIEDNGTVIKSKNSMGIGLLSICNRIENLRGQVQFPEREKGFSIEIKIPLG